MRRLRSHDRPEYARRCDRCQQSLDALALQWPRRDEDDLADLLRRLRAATAAGVRDFDAVTGEHEPAPIRSQPFRAAGLNSFPVAD